MNGQKDQDITYVLRTCDKDMKGHGGFQWPESGFVEAPDWNPDPVISCGSGLHGLEWGQGDAGLLNWHQNARWLVVKVVKSEGFLAGKDKCRYKRGEVVFAGGLVGACQKLREVGYAGSALPGELITAGDRGQATAGYRGQATAGYWGQATAGDWGQATAGDWGQATAGDRGQATAGDGGQATAGYRGQATAGDRGLIILKRWDGERYRAVVLYPGENGIKANTKYKLDDAGNPVEVTEEKS